MLHGSRAHAVTAVRRGAAASMSNGWCGRLTEAVALDLDDDAGIGSGLDAVLDATGGMALMRCSTMVPTASPARSRISRAPPWREQFGNQSVRDRGC